MIIYQDEFCTAQMSDEPAAAGHLIVYPNEAKHLEQLSHEQSSLLFTVASIASSMLFELIKPQGTNIIACNGKHAYLNAEQNDRVVLHILPRSMEDNLGLMWQPKQGDQNDVAQRASAIKEHMMFGDVKEQQAERIQMAAPQEENQEQNENGQPEQDLRKDDIFRKYY